MSLTVSENANPNYLAQVVQIGKIEKHPNADKLQLVEVQHSTVITGLQAKEGDWYVYIPVESQLSKTFLSWSNGFQDPELNEDKTEKSFFGRNCRVRMLKLREVYSNGYIFPFEELQKFAKEKYKKNLDGVHPNFCFDTVCGELFVKKYFPIINAPQVRGQKSKGKIHKQKFNKLIEHQFTFHPDTQNARREIERIEPEDYISITKKFHGSCFGVSNVLCKRQLNWKDKIAKFFGVKVQEAEYGLVYNSRAVIKNDCTDLGWYKEDLWRLPADVLYPKLDKGIRITGEIIGWTPNGKEIQKGYCYGLPQGKCDFVVFKVDYTNIDGENFTFSHPQFVEYCTRKGFRMPEVYYYGKAKDLFPELNTEQHWKENFLKKLEETYLGKRETSCQTDVPAEGVVISIARPLGWEALKLKDLEFLGYETKMLDQQEAGEIELNNENEMENQYNWMDESSRISKC